MWGDTREEHTENHRQRTREKEAGEDEEILRGEEEKPNRDEGTRDLVETVTKILLTKIL